MLFIYLASLMVMVRLLKFTTQVNTAVPPDGTLTSLGCAVIVTIVKKIHSIRKSS